MPGRGEEETHFHIIYTRGIVYAVAYALLHAYYKRYLVAQIQNGDADKSTLQHPG